MFTDNINWDSLKNIKGKSFSPKQINRTLFINQWDDSVVYMLRGVWEEQQNPRAIVFCGTIEHALIMRDKINSLGFCKAEAIYSGTSGGGYTPLSQYQRNRILSDFSEGLINVVCAVDIFNEGIRGACHEFFKCAIVAGMLSRFIGHENYCQRNCRYL